MAFDKSRLYPADDSLGAAVACQSAFLDPFNGASFGLRLRWFGQACSGVPALISCAAPAARKTVAADIRARLDRWRAEYEWDIR